MKDKNNGDRYDPEYFQRKYDAFWDCLGLAWIIVPVAVFVILAAKDVL